MKKGRWKARRCLGVLLAVIMVLSLIPANGLTLAVNTEEEEPAAVTVMSEPQIYIPDVDSLPDNDELFAMYVYRTLYGESGIAPLANYGEAALSGANLVIYQELKAAVQRIAKGEQSSTEITITADLGLEWETDKTGTDLDAEIAEKYSAAVDRGRIVDYLLVDCPYDLYWFDKTRGASFGRVISTISSGNVTTVRIGVTVKMYVAAGYQDGNDTTVNTEKVSAASKAAANAQAIVEANAGKSDYEKMIAYRDEICKLVSYNYAAAGDNYSDGYGDPWQLIYVFDDDASTNVVCEGYSKAFQYLCDMSGLTCYTVTGEMSGGTGAGGHMWNIVTLNGKNYLVDVTNSDTGSVGQNGGLFLVGNSTGSAKDGYSFTIGSQTITFTYDSDTLGMYDEAILTLAATDYDSDTVTKDEVSITGISADSARVTYGYQKAPVLTVEAQGSGALAYQWYQGAEGSGTAIDGATGAEYALLAGLNAGTYTYYCEVSCGSAKQTSAATTVTVEKASLENAVVAVSGEFVYDGTAKVPSVTVTLDGVTVAPGEYEISYSNTNGGDGDHTNAGTVTVSVTAKVDGNYSGSGSGSFVISQASPVCVPPVGLTAEYGSKLAAVSLTNAAGNTPGSLTWKDEDELVGAVGEQTHTAIFTPTDITNYTTAEIDVKVLVYDTQAPAGEITVGTDSWKKFLNTITFGRFFRDTQTITITGTDNTAASVTIEYLLADGERTESELSDAVWTEYIGTVSVQPGKYVVYARITDESGNSIVINSDGIVVYTDSAADTETVAFVRKSNADVTASVKLNGNTVAGIANGAASLAEGSDYTVAADGTITLKADYLNTLAAGSYTLTVSYNPQGVSYVEGEGNAVPASTSIRLIVVKASGSVSITGDISKIYDGTPVTNPDYTASGAGAVTIEYKEQNADDSAYTAAAPKNAGAYTVRVTAEADEEHSAASAEANFTISRKQVTVNGVTVAAEKEYDASTVAEITNAGVLSANYDGGDLSIQTGTAVYDTKNAGKGKTVSFTGFALAGSAAGNYELTGQPASVTADITAKELTVDVAVKNKQYDGRNTAEIEHAALNGVLPGDTVDLVNGEAVFESAELGENIAVHFSGFAITGTDAGNYFLTQPDSVKASIVEYVAVKGTDYVVNSNEWQREDFVVTAAEGYRLSAAGAADGVWSDSLTASAETADGSLTFYVKNMTTGAISAEVTEYYRIDRSTPVGEITIGTDSWKEFLNTITFGRFFKDTQTVKIDAEDVLSGVDSVQYYLADRALSLEEAEALTDWTDYTGTLSISPYHTYVVYAKITDKAGNTAYLSSDGLILDNMAPIIAGIADGETYYGDVAFTVTDTCLETVTVDGEIVEPADGSYTIAADNQEHTVAAVDKAGNRAERTVKVYRIYTVTFVADGEIIATREVNYGAELTDIPEVPAKVGYDQTAPVWNTTDFADITQNMTVEAVYTINTYTVTYVADGVVVDTQTVTHGGAAAAPAIPEKEGFDRIAPCWNPGNQSNVTADQTVTAVYFPDQAEEVELPETDDGMKVKLVIEQGLSTVPESLRETETLNTPEKIAAVLKTVITQKNTAVADVNTALYDVSLLVNLNDGNGWVLADAEHFPSNGKLTVVLPYPEGTAKDTHDFTVVHMFTTDDFGKTPGDTETPAVAKTEEGIQFEVTGLSPIIVGWTEIEDEPEQPGTTPENPDKDDTSVQNPDKTTPTNPTTPTSPTNPTAPTTSANPDRNNPVVENPHTGDDSSLWLWIAVMAVACVVMTGAVIGIIRKRNKR